ncbi:YncE family protein [Halobacteriaceae archaeon GCM10025711]
MKNLRGEGFTVVDAETHERVGELGSGKHPHAVAVHPGGRWAFVPFMTSGTVEVVDLRALAVTDTTDAVGEAPVGAAVTRGGRYLFVTSYGPLPGRVAPGITVFETDAGHGSLSLVDHLPVGKAAGVVVDAANTVWVALKDENAIVRLDGTPPFAERDRFPVAADPQDVAYSQAYGLLGVNGVDAGRVTFVDTLDGELLADVPAPNPRGGTAVPAHDRWFVSDTDGDGLTVVDLDAVRRGSGGASAVERITQGQPPRSPTPRRTAATSSWTRTTTTASPSSTQRRSPFALASGPARRRTTRSSPRTAARVTCRTWTPTR